MADLIVTTENDSTDADDGALSLREAIALAASSPEADVIRFARGIEEIEIDAADPSGGNSVFSGFRIDDAGGLTIDGDRNRDGLPDVEISGVEKTAHFVIETGSLVALTGLELVDGFNAWNADLGRAPTNRAGVDGADAFGSILNQGDLTLERVVFEDNIADAQEGQDGGNGGNGGTGYKGPDGRDASKPSLTRYIPALPGDHGGRGDTGDDGGGGGDGGVAATVLSFGSLAVGDVAFGPGNETAGGDGGQGGAGGGGGAGGKGGQGGDGIFASSAKSEVGGNGGKGGTGGDGGQGGDGGTASNGIISFGALTALTAIAAPDPSDPATAGAAGVAGTRGAGGDGGAGGLGGKIITRADSGSKGGTGASGSSGAAGTAGTADPAALNLGTGADPATADTVVFAHGRKAVVAEGSDMKFTIARVGSSDTAFTVDWEVDLGNGTWRKDFEDSRFSGEVSFVSGGADVQTITLDTARDGRLEGVETFEFEISNARYTSDTDESLAIGTDEAAGEIRDYTRGGRGDDRIRGTNDSEVISGGRGKGDDTLFGRGGDDKLLGGSGNDRLYGGKGDDDLRGGNFGDLAKGGGGDDRISGGNGRDELHGGGGDDEIYGGRGGDDLIGNKGADLLKGGGGPDDFIFRTRFDSTASNTDLIDGFGGAGRSGGDRIDVSKIDADLGRKGNQAFDFGDGRDAGDLWAEEDDGDTLIYGNIDDDAEAEIVIRIADGDTAASDYFSEDFIL